VLLVDTGVLLAAADAADPDHDACAQLVAANAGQLVTTALVVAETGYLIGRQLGPRAEAAFYRSVADGDLKLEVLTVADLRRIAELAEIYADFPLGGTDASLVAVAERLRQDTIATIDHRHFSVVRPEHVAAFTLLP
jgi:uncharacterized protein